MLRRMEREGDDEVGFTIGSIIPIGVDKAATSPVPAAPDVSSVGEFPPLAGSVFQGRTSPRLEEKRKAAAAAPVAAASGATRLAANRTSPPPQVGQKTKPWKPMSLAEINSLLVAPQKGVADASFVASAAAVIAQ
jgi:hypothetical protein